MVPLDLFERNKAVFFILIFDKPNFYKNLESDYGLQKTADTEIIDQVYRKNPNEAKLTNFFK